jgi:hypothetical protein
LRVEADGDFGGFFRARHEGTLKKGQGYADEKNKSGHGSANLRDLRCRMSPATEWTFYAN